MFVYRWDMVRELLDKHRDHEGDPHDGLLVEYIDPTSGQPVFKTITFFAQMLQPAQKTLQVKSTSSLLVSPYEGEGYSIVNGQRFDWNVYDTLAIPGGAWFEHHNTSAKKPLYMFVASDEPTLKKLDLYKKWGKSVSGETTQFAA
jgi:gentisate 1,2-dioxygenase